MVVRRHVNYTQASLDGPNDRENEETIKADFSTGRSSHLPRYQLGGGKKARFKFAHKC